MKTIDETLTVAIIGLTIFSLTFLTIVLKQEDAISINNAEILASEEGPSFGRNKEWLEKYRQEYDYKVYMNR